MTAVYSTYREVEHESFVRSLISCCSEVSLSDLRSLSRCHNRFHPSHNREAETQQITKSTKPPLIVRLQTMATNKVTVVAPSTLDAGYTFEAQVDGKNVRSLYSVCFTVDTLAGLSERNSGWCARVLIGEMISSGVSMWPAVSSMLLLLPPLLVFSHLVHCDCS